MHTFFPLPLRFRVVLLLAFTAAVMLVGAAPANAVQSGTLGIRPATESDFFHLTVSPGSATTSVAVISNQAATPVTLLTYPVDATTSAQGTFAMGPRTATPKGVGSWVHLTGGSVTVPAHGTTNVPFHLSVPSGVTPGDYAGALIIQAPPVTGKTATVKGRTAVRLDIVQRQGVRIYLHIPGNAIRTQQVSTPTWSHTGVALQVTESVKNTGSVTLNPTAHFTLTGWPTHSPAVTGTVPQALLPGASYTFKATLPNASSLEAGTITSTLTSAAGTHVSRMNVFYLPWLLTILFLVALGAAVFFGTRFARFLRRARHALAHTPTPGTSGHQARGPQHAAR